jgi:hypothetical protein
VDGVKVDVQSTLTMFGHDSGERQAAPSRGLARCSCRPPLPNVCAPAASDATAAKHPGLAASCAGGYAAIGARWHRSLEDSVAAHLPGNHVINSMCCALEDLYK